MVCIIKETWFKGSAETSFSRILKTHPSEEVLLAYIFGKYPYSTYKISGKAEKLKVKVNHAGKGVKANSEFQFIVFDESEKENLMTFAFHPNDIKFIRNIKSTQVK